MTPRVTAFVLATSLAAAGSARADETTFCNTFITSLPYTINVQGHYCFNRNLSVNITTGNAITINADYVVLDLNNFKLGGGAAGPATDAIGISAFQRSNTTIRNGNIRGFAHGIVVDGSLGTKAQNVTIENNVVDGNYKTGINVFGENIVVRHNLVTNTGGSTSANLYCEFDGGRIEGISTRERGCVLAGGGPIVIHDNNVLRTGMVSPPGEVHGIMGNGALVRNNTVFQVMDNSGGKGIGAMICRDNNVTGVSTGTADNYQCTYLDGVNSSH
jgi:hypothetical protein